LNVNNKSRKSTAHWRRKERKKLDDYNTRIHDKSFKAAAAGKNKQNVITSCNSPPAKNKQRNSSLALPCPCSRSDKWPEKEEKLN